MQVLQIQLKYQPELVLENTDRLENILVLTEFTKLSYHIKIIGIIISHKKNLNYEITISKRSYRRKC